MLEEAFEKTHYPDLATRDKLSARTSLSEARIQVERSHLYSMLHMNCTVHFAHKNLTK